MTTQKQAQLICPECKSTAYKDKRGLATHRRYQHGVISQEPSAVKQRQDKAKRRAQSKDAVMAALQAMPQGKNHMRKGDYPCPHCDFVAKWNGGLTHHIKAAHSINPKEPTLASTEARIEISLDTNNNHNKQARRSAIPEAAIAFTAGRIEELLLRTATELDLPPKSLAAGVIELIHAKTLR